MNRLLLIPLFAVFSACVGEEHPPARAPTSAPARAEPALPARASKHALKAPVPLAEYFKTARVRGLSFSYDEKVVVTMSDRSGRDELWIMPVGGGHGTQITHMTGFIHSFAFSPVADVLAYESDNGGNELPHLFVTNSKGDSPKDIAPDLPTGARTRFVDWADDGETLLYLSSARDVKRLDLCEYDLMTGQSKVLWKSEGALAFDGVSDDHRRFLLAETKSDANNDLYVVERARPTAKRLLTAHTGDVLSDGGFTHDGDTLLLTSDDGREFRSLYLLKLATGKRTVAHEEDWDVEWSADSRSGKYRFFQVNADGSPRLSIVEVKTGKALELPPPPWPGLFWDGVDSMQSGPFPLGFSKSERYLGLVARGDTTPPVPYVIDLKSGTAAPIEDPLPPSLKLGAGAGYAVELETGTTTKIGNAKLKILIGPWIFGQPSVRIPAPDGKTIPAFLYAPPGDGPFPAVIDVHDGPTAQSRREFSAMRQYLFNKGYVVLVPNVRGSTGYGKTWTRLNNHDIGGGPLRDVVACKQYLVDHAHVAADEVAVMGGGYGGYLALAAATFTPKEFRANVDFFGVSDLTSLEESSPPYWMAASAAIHVKFGDPKNSADASYQHDQSPLFFIDRVAHPLLVVQGEEDARVKKDQSDRVVEGLRSRHLPVHYLLLEGEGHGFTKQESMRAAYALTDRFFDHYLLGDDSVAVE